MVLREPPPTENWLALHEDALPVERVLCWVGQPDCGATVIFTGNARNHAKGRSNVTGLAYEAYEEQAVLRLGEIADEARRRWPSVGRLALLHRTGFLEIGDVAVVVAVSAPHRPEAFVAARWCIDTLKETVPIWKSESWDGGEHWATDGRDIVEVSNTNEGSPIDTAISNTANEETIGMKIPWGGK